MNAISMLKAAVICSLLLSIPRAYAEISAPLTIERVTVDTVGLTHPSKVTIRVLAAPWLRNITARIVEGEGYRVLSQPPNTVDSLLRGDTAIFVGAFQPLVKGTWKVRVQALTRQGSDTAEVGENDEFYILLTDTLNRALSATDYILLPHEKRMKRQGVKPDSIIYTPGLKQAKPKPQKNTKQVEPNSKGKSGTFNLIGSSYWHDPRDGASTYRPEVNVTIEVWNCNRFDSPPSDDALLGTATTDGYGCFSFWWLDNSDANGTADPYLVWVTENSSWTVSRPIPGTVYRWYSDVVWDAPDDSTVDFGDFYPTPGDPDEGATWCFQYINLGWNTAQYVGPYPDPVWCTWPAASQSASGGAMYISQTFADAVDIVNHEYAHCLMYQAYGGSIPVDCIPPRPQYLNVAYCKTFAWTEGWAEFFPLVVTPDGVIDYHPAGPSYNHYSLEIPKAGPAPDSMQWGDSCSGRVAGALLDLWDTNNDGLDQNSSNPVDFSTIYTWGIQSHRDSTFYQYWAYLRNNELNAQQIALGLNSIENNTIHFDCTSCGDANSTDTFNISDAVYLIAYIFAGGRPPADCNYAKGKGDADGTGTVNVSDAVYLIAYIFAGGAAPHCQ